MLKDYQRAALGQVSILWRGAGSFQDRFFERREALQIREGGPHRAYLAAFIDVGTLYDAYGRYLFRDHSWPNLNKHLVTMTVREEESVAQIVENFDTRPLRDLPDGGRDHHFHTLELYTVIPLHEPFPSMRTCALNEHESKNLPVEMTARIQEALDIHNATCKTPVFKKPDWQMTF
ncbi:MAG: hypothetical protein AB7E85_06875 [Pseudobdellovibrionaceae bacterium]